VLLTLAAYYLVAVPTITKLSNVALGSAAVQEAGRQGLVHFIYNVSILYFPLILGMGVLVWLVVSATRQEAYRGVR